MPGVIRPPFGAPTGPQVADTEVVTRFIEGARTGHSSNFHIEDGVLLADRMTPASLRLSIGALLIRTDIPCPELELGAKENELHRVVVDPPLATVISLQMLGLPAASWDLWTHDSIDAGSALENAAMSGTDDGFMRPF